MSERRSSKRRRMLGVVRIEYGDDALTTYVSELSQTGLFVRTSRQIPIHTPVRVALGIPDSGPPILADGIVMRWHERGQDLEDASGIGVRFVEVTPSDSTRLSRICGNGQTTPRQPKAGPPRWVLFFLGRRGVVS